MSLVDMAGEAFVIATVVVAALALACVWYLLFGRNRNASIDSIAVLPFQNKSVNTDAEYLFDGLTYRLSQLPNLESERDELCVSLFFSIARTGHHSLLGR